MPKANIRTLAELNAAADASLAKKLVRQLGQDKAAAEPAKFQQVRQFAAARKHVKNAIAAAKHARQTKRISQQDLEAFMDQLTA